MSTTTTSQTPEAATEQYWDERWKTENTPWDAKKGAPIVQHLIETNYFKETAPKTALVPGCGTGYDCYTLCNLSSLEKIVGLDISETANARAKELLKQAEKHYQEKIEFRKADFFALGEKFDLVFDYTFLCALPPFMREQWAQAYKNIMTPETGRLVTLIFPLRGPPSSPPFQIDLDLVKGLLEPLGFECVHSAPCTISHPARAGNEHLAIWKLKNAKV